jgi:predicted aconitase
MAVRLTRDEEAMLAGEQGEAVSRALHFQKEVAAFFGASRFIPVTSAHVMAEIESMGEAGLRWVEELAALDQPVRVPTTCNPRSVDFQHWEKIGQTRRQVELEERLSRALERLGVVVVNTCINYQTFNPPRFGEHLAWGDTGTVIFANSVAGARTNYEGGPAALAAALTGRTPDYGFHLPEQRLGTALVEVRDQPRNTTDWGALGCYVGRRVNDYWQVPVLTGLETSPTVDQLKHLGACLASYGSLAMFHLVGVTPEARTVEEAFAGRTPSRHLEVPAGALQETYASFQAEKPEVDLVVFSAPQLSVLELRDIATRLRGKQIHPRTRLLVTTNAANCAVAAQLGYLQAIEAAGGLVLSGSCFYLLTPWELADRFGYHTIVTDSAKLANIIAGSGYNPVFRPTDTCIEAALTGKVV